MRGLNEGDALAEGFSEGARGDAGVAKGWRRLLLLPLLLPPPPPPLTPLMSTPLRLLFFSRGFVGAPKRRRGET